MSSRFSRGSFDSYYCSQLPESSGSGSTSSDPQLHQVIQDMQRKTEEMERQAEERERLHQDELQRVRETQEKEVQDLRQSQLDLQKHVHEMMQRLSAMESRPPQSRVRQQRRHSDYVDDDEVEDDDTDVELRFTRHRAQ